MDRAAIGQIYEERQKIIYDLCEERLSSFVKCAWDVLEPGTELKWNWHLDAISEALQSVMMGETKRLIIAVPPRSLKSIIGTICFPVFCWSQQSNPSLPLMGPSARFITVSHSQTLAAKHSMDRRTIIQSEWYRERWGDGHFQISEDTNRQMEFSNDARGSMMAVSMGGAVLGRGCNCLLFDDPSSTDSVASEVERSKNNQDFDQKFLTRLDDKKNGAVIIISQRLHTADIAGHALSSNPGAWTVLKLPAEATERQVVHFPISKRTPVIREIGAVLHPEREDKPILESIKRSLGARVYAGQYLQEPVELEGGVFKRAWWKEFNPKAAPRFDIMIQSWDFSVKANQSSDFVCGLVVGKKGADRYILDMFLDRVDFPGSCVALKQMTAKWPQTYKKAIEAKANGPAIIAQLKSTVTGLVEVEPIGDKMQRASACAPEVEAGNWHIPVGAAWVSDFLLQVCAFPNGRHDDCVDALSQSSFVLRNSGAVSAPTAGHYG